MCCYGSDVSLQVISLSHMLRSEQPYWELYSSFTDIDPRVGTMSEFADVIKRAERLNVKVRYLDGCHSRHYTDRIGKIVNLAQRRHQLCDIGGHVMSAPT